MTTPQDAEAHGLADRIALATASVPGVAGLHAGSFGEVGTYLPGRRVDGVRVGPDAAEVHVVVTMGFALRDVADEVRTAVGQVVDTPVQVVVEDVVPAADGSVAP